MSLLQKRLEQLREPGRGGGQAAPYASREAADEAAAPTSSRRNQMRDAKERVMKDAVETIDVDAVGHMPEADWSKYLSEAVGTLSDRVLRDMDLTLTRAEHHRLIGEVISEIDGYGPITQLLADPTVSEIMVNGADKVFVERAGKIQATDVTFKDDGHVMRIIERIVAPLGKRIDESSPMVDARLPDGSRVNATIPPVSLNGPVITIRKFSAKPYTMSDLVKFGTLNANMASYLKACVEGRVNIIVGGGTGSGKTTTLNVLSSFIPGSERIITIEDAAELQLMQEHVVRLECRPPNVEGKGHIAVRDLVINSLRMRPDRIVVGEVRGGEALDMLQAMNTGHDGSLTTGHANTPRDLLSRLETMVLMAGVELPVRAIREQIVGGIQLIVHQSRMKDGSRKVTKITEIAGMEGEVITLQDVFVFEEQGVSQGKVQGVFKGTGVVPKILPALEARGICIPMSVFS